MSIELGTAGEHLVCADLLLSGHRASLAIAGCPYDVIADVCGILFKVTVKSASAPRPRAGRFFSKPVYTFSVQRHQKRSSGRYEHLRYDAADVDIVAFVALDIRRVAYIALSECASCVVFDLDPPQLSASHFGPKGRVNNCWHDRTLDAALEKVMIGG